MISILTSLKPCTGDAARIQDRALANWRRLGAAVEIILYGDGEGVATRAAAYGARHVPDIRSNGAGVPDFSAIAAHAAAHAAHDQQVYLNGDILLPPDFVETVQRVALPAYLVVGQRIELAQHAVFDHLATDWTGEIRRANAAGTASLRGSEAQDYFVFPRGLWRDLAPLIVGRGYYDNALLAYCLRRGTPIIDATTSLHVVHQWHDYSHNKSFAETYQGPDAQANMRTHDIAHSGPNIEDAGWRLAGGQVVACGGSPNPFRRLELRLRYAWRFRRASYVCRAVTRLAWLGGFLKPRAWSVDFVLRDERGVSA